MKKTALTILLAGTAMVFANGQTIEDAFLLSENNYEGTARTIALGNAVTALGGDLGAVTINPASSAVAKYSQITITPGLSFAATNTQGISPWADGSLPYFQSQMRTASTRFLLPNIGFSFNWDTRRSRGVKNVSFGFIVNSTNSWNEDVYAKGVNSTTTYLGAMATGASGFTFDELLDDNAFYNGVPWNAAIGAYTGMIAPTGSGAFIGATEAELEDGQIVLAGDIDQTFGMRRMGSKYDYLFNVGMNISDFIYIGANIGITSASYSYSQYIKESAVNTSDFEIIMEDENGVQSLSYFNNMTYKTMYSLNTTGVYGKLGVIVTPFAGLRIGAAIQTPTLLAIKDNFSESGEAFFSGKGGGSFSETSPAGENRYSLSSPFRANIGVAYTFGRKGLISADYEICNYGQMKYRSSAYTDRQDLEYINQDIRTIYGAGHSLRLGGEFKPIEQLAIRLGYGLTTSADKQDLYGNRYPTLYSHDVAFGLGFSSKGSFFLDAAVKREFRNAISIKLYDDYIGYYDNNDNFVADIDFPSPEIKMWKSTWKAVLTLGWRF